MDFPVIQQSQIPHVRTDQMVEVDRLMTDVYKVGLIQMMENAGRHLGSLARRRFPSSSARGPMACRAQDLRSRVPPALYASPSLGLEVGHLFSESDIVRVD